MIVVDASVAVRAAANDDREGLQARERLAMDPDLHAPHLIDLEFTSALRKMTRRGALGQERAAAALEDFRLLRLKRYAHPGLIQRVWDLRGNLTPYDAAYIALAEALGCVFLTADAHLAKVKDVRCPVELLR